MNRFISARNLVLSSALASLLIGRANAADADKAQILFDDNLDSQKIQDVTNAIPAAGPKEAFWSGIGGKISFTNSQCLSSNNSARFFREPGTFAATSLRQSTLYENWEPGTLQALDLDIYVVGGSGLGQFQICLTTNVGMSTITDINANLARGFWRNGVTDTDKDIALDAWQHFRQVFDVSAQRFNLYIDRDCILTNVAYRLPPNPDPSDHNYVRILLCTAAKDGGYYIDNVHWTAVPKPKVKPKASAVFPKPTLTATGFSPMSLTVHPPTLIHPISTMSTSALLLVSAWAFGGVCAFLRQWKSGRHA